MVKKHLRAQEVAEQNRLPCVYLVDSGGAFLPMQDEVFRPRPLRPHLLQPGSDVGEGDPEIAVVMGRAPPAARYVPAMSDETVIVRGTGTIFLGAHRS